MKRLSIYTLVLASLISVFFSSSTSAQTVSLNDGAIVQNNTKRIGMNIGAIDFYDNGQVLKNLVGAINPGFEPATTKQIWALTTAGTTTSFVNSAMYDPVPQNYWTGATFTVVNSQTNKGQLGCTGTIASNSGQTNIVSIKRSGGIVTVTTTSPSLYVAGNQMAVENVADNSFNGYPAGTITSVSGNTITFSQSGADSTSSGGLVDQLAPPIYVTSSPCGGPFSVGDIVIISQTVFPTPESWWETSGGGFWAEFQNGGKLTSDTTDLCPTCGSQAINLDATASNSAKAGAAFYFDGDTIGSADNFVLMNGTFQISFWAKAAAGSPTLSISANRNSTGGFNCGTYKQVPTSTWAQYTFSCTASETSSGTAVGSVNLSIFATGGSVYVDNVDFEKTGSSQPSVLRDEVISALRSFKPGTFRYWINQNGESADNWTRPDYARGVTGAGFGYEVKPAGGDAINLSLEDYLVICQTLNAEPYLEVPITFSPADATALIEFLAGPSTTTYGARRIALGQQAPWTTVFPKIHLSFGNEAWNFISFVGQNLPQRSTAPNDPNCPWVCPNDYYDYSQRSKTIFAAMRSAPDYTPAPFDLVMDMETSGYFLADDAIKTAQPDSVEVEDYTYWTVSDTSSDAALWQPAFVEPYDTVADPNEPTGFYKSVHDYQKLNACGSTGTQTCNMNIYEWADGTNQGSIDQTHLDYINAGAGQGIVAALEPLLNLQYYGIQNQNYFSLTELYNSGPNGELAKLWGSVVDMGGSTNNARPQFLAMSLVNQSIIGPMYSCPINNNVTYNFAGNAKNGTYAPPGIPALNNVPTLYSFCFENGTSRSVVLINTDITQSHAVNFSGTNTPQGAVTVRQYAPSSLDDMNEAPTGSPSNHAVATVQLETNTVSDPTSITLPPYSVTALDFTASGVSTTAAPVFSLIAGTYAGPQQVTITSSTSGATIYYTTNGSTPTTSSAVYSSPLTISSSETLQAIAAASGLNNSAVTEAGYTISSATVATPTISPAGGTFTSTQQVTISDSTTGATIYYTTDGTTPTAASTVYSGAISVAASEKLQAIAVKSGSANSSVASATFTFTSALPAPIYSPAAGTYTGAQTVTITSAAGATIYYTTDGSTPTTSSIAYVGPVAVAASETLSAIAIESGFANSAVSSAAYTINSTLPTPVFNPAGGTYPTAQSVTITSATAGATIYYTTDGTTPTTSSSIYSTPITVSASEILEAIAVAPAASATQPNPLSATPKVVDSSVATADYTISAGSTTYVNVAKDGFSANTLKLTGGATVTTGMIQLTDGKQTESRSAWFSKVVPVQSFVTDFTFEQLDADGDGMTFVIYGGSSPSTGSLGGGGGLGYQGLAKSVAVKFDLYNNAGEGYDSTGFYLDGASPTVPATDLTPSGVILRSGDVMHAHLTYNGTNLTMTLTDTVTNKTATATRAVNIPSVVGGNTAYIGFTGASGGATAIQNVLSWSYVSTSGGTVETFAASPTFSPAAGTYSAAQTVTISTATPGATIYYTTNGTMPTTASTVYKAPITVSESTTIQAIAVESGYKNSAEIAAAYSITTGLRTRINYPNHKVTLSKLSLQNGAVLNNGTIQLTDGGSNESSSAWYTAPVPVQSFVSEFTFQQANGTGEGMTYVIRGSNAAVQGQAGSGLGYQGIPQSVAIKFDMVDAAGEGPDSTGIYLNGAAPTVPAIDLSTTGVNLHSGHLMKASFTYDGTNLTLTVTDTQTHAQATEIFPIDIPSIVGGNTAYVGFTGSTGTQASVQSVTSWNYLSQQ